jgi:ABC-type transport system involved in cytochrome c biogenesis permease subunit
MSVNFLLFKVTLVLYSISTILYLVDVVRHKEKAGKTARGILIGGFVLHCSTLLARYLEAGYTPVANLHESLSFFAWALVGIFLLFDMRYRITVLGAFSCPLAVILMLIGSTATTVIREVNPILNS